MSKIGICVLFFFVPCFAFAQQQRNNFVQFLGEEQPGLTPKIFFARTISLPERYEFGSTFSADGKEFFYATEINRKPEIWYARRENNSWATPILLLSHTKYGYNDPFLSPDGKKLFFISDRALDGTGDKKDIDIWFIERT